MNHWRNETLSKMFFFLIAGLRFIRLRDKGKLIKYVDVWSFVFISAEQALKCNSLIRFPSLWLPGSEEDLMRKADGLATCMSDWLASILSSPEAAMIWRGHTSIKPASEKLPS